MGFRTPGNEVRLPGMMSDPQVGPRESGSPGLGEISSGLPGLLGIPGADPRDQDTLLQNDIYPVVATPRARIPAVAAGGAIWC